MFIDSASAVWFRRFWPVLIKRFWFKGLGTMAFTFVFFVAYVYLLRNPVFPVTVMPVTVIDESVGFQPLALLPYLSLWAYVSLPPLFFTSVRELCGYGWRIACVCLFGLFVFYVWPTAVPPANIDWAQYPGMAFLKGVDAAGNACPSLHVATAVFSCVWLDRLLRNFGTNFWGLAANWLWCLLIAWSTLATRQHVFVDVAAGVLMGLLGAALSLRQWDSRFPALVASGSSSGECAESSPRKA